MLIVNFLKITKIVVHFHVNNLARLTIAIYITVCVLILPPEIFRASYWQLVGGSFFLYAINPVKCTHLYRALFTLDDHTPVCSRRPSDRAAVLPSNSPPPTCCYAMAIASSALCYGQKCAAL